MHNRSSLFAVFFSATILSYTVFSAPVNIMAAEDIAEALDGVDLTLASEIQIHCELLICTKPEDLNRLPGMSKELLEKIRPDLMFDIIERGMDQNDEC